MRLNFGGARQPVRRGAAAVELAMLLPVFRIFISGLWEVGRIAEIQQILNEAARQGGRQASTSLVTSSNVQQVVTTFLQNANVPTGHVTINVDNLTHPGVDADVAAQLDQFRVTVSIPFSDVRWVALPLVTNSSTTLTAQATWYSMADKSYPSPAPPAIE
jgi:Flp pilus assembly protein TadG